MSVILIKLNSSKYIHFSDGLCIAGIQNQDVFRPTQVPSFSIKDLIGDGILWAVPKHRRSVEKRLKRKYGCPEYVVKTITPKTNLRVCNKCGHDHEVGVLCRKFF